jgi:hypothetical protein
MRENEIWKNKNPKNIFPNFRKVKNFEEMSSPLTRSII